MTQGLVHAQDRALSSWAKRLQYYVYETVGAMRIGQFFDIVVGLPESLPALADVRGCLQHTNSHARFIQRFGAAISLRLLHPGLLQRLILNPEPQSTGSLLCSPRTDCQKALGPGCSAPAGVHTCALQSQLRLPGSRSYCIHTACIAAQGTGIETRVWLPGV